MDVKIAFWVKHILTCVMSSVMAPHCVRSELATLEPFQSLDASTRLHIRNNEGGFFKVWCLACDVVWTSVTFFLIHLSIYFPNHLFIAIVREPLVYWKREQGLSQADLAQVEFGTALCLTLGIFHNLSGTSSSCRWIRHAGQQNIGSEVREIQF